MPVNLMKTVARLEGVCNVEEADTLYEWLREHPRGKVNLKRLRHVNGAVLQVLMAARPVVSAEPEDAQLARWLLPAIGAGLCESGQAAQERDDAAPGATAAAAAQG